MGEGWRVILSYSTMENEMREKKHFKQAVG